MRRLCAIAMSLAIVAGTAAQQPQLRLRLQASGFANPVAFVQDPSDRSVQFVVQQHGHINNIKNKKKLNHDLLNL